MHCQTFSLNSEDAGNTDMLDLSGSTMKERKRKRKHKRDQGSYYFSVIRINSLCPVSSVADEVAYIREGIVNEVKEEPFGE